MDAHDLKLPAVPVTGTDPYPDNVVRKQNWLDAHQGDMIRLAENHRYGFWYEAVRDGKVIAEANDLGLLMNRLEADFK